jgi:hypothetical protein
MSNSKTASRSTVKRPLTTGYSAIKKKNNIPCGYLEVTIVGCSDLLAVNTSLVSKSSSDPFCNIYLDDKDQMIQTPIISNNIHPKWDFPASFLVYNPASTLLLEVNNHGSDSRIQNPLHKHEDIALGQLSIQLSALPYNETFEGWFALSEPKEGNPHHHPHQHHQKNKLLRSRSSSLKIPLSSSPQVEEFGRIMLRIHYETTKQAQFYAGFLPPPPPPIEPPLPFAADIAYHNLMRCLDYLWIILDVIWSIMDLQSWVSPIKSVISLIFWVYICKYYQYLPVIVHLCLILKMCIEYVKLFIKEHPHGAVEVDKIRKTMKPIHNSINNNKEDDAASIGTFVNKLTTYLIGRGWTETLQNSQNVLGVVADSLDNLTGLMKWKNYDTSFATFIILITSCLLFACVSFRYWLLIGSVYIMTSCTRPYAFLIYTMFVLKKYFSLNPSFNGMKNRLPSLLKVRKVQVSK